MRPRLFLFLFLFRSVLALGEGMVDRFTLVTRPLRKNLLEKGLAGELTDAPRKAQFYLLLCQPRRAWWWAERIEDPVQRTRFEAVILALSSVKRSSEAGLSGSKEIEHTAPVAAAFDLDPDEVWADEIPDIQIAAACRFPAAVAGEELSREARQRFRTLATPQDLALLALETDVALKPRIERMEFERLSLENPNSPYLPRLKFFSEEPLPASPPEFRIQGTRAKLTPLRFSDLRLIAHRLEMPWLLEK